MEKRFVLNEAMISWTEVDDGIVVLHLEDSRYLTINESGAQLWRQLQIGATAADLQGFLVDALGVEPAVAVKDVIRFLEDLVQQGLVLTDPR